MEHRKPHEIINQLFEARAALRSCTHIEKALIEYIDHLPYDDFCHHARESAQLGAGYGALIYNAEAHAPVSATKLSSATDHLSIDELQSVMDSFHAIQPRNRYEDKESTLLRRKHLSHLALLVLSGHELTGDENVDEYTLEAIVAFTQGYALVSSAHRQT